MKQAEELTYNKVAEFNSLDPGDEVLVLLPTDSPRAANNCHYYPTALRRVQITPKTSTNITRYLYSRGPVRQV